MRIDTEPPRLQMPRAMAEKPTQPTPFSQQHFHELSADETEARERGFESLGSPVEGPSQQKAEQEAEPAPPSPHRTHTEPSHAPQTPAGPTRRPP